MSRPPRVAGFDYRGPYRYFLTFCTFERQKTFLNPQAATCVLKQFRRTARASAFAILAYCVMPDHDRILRPTDDAKTIARYIVANPVRAGLVRSPAEYPHIGSDVWSLDELIESVR